MGLYEYRPPTALGGITQAWVYREDLVWLAAEAAVATQWLSRPDRPVRVDAADVLHGLVAAHEGQLSLPFRPQMSQPRGWRSSSSPVRGVWRSS